MIKQLGTGLGLVLVLVAPLAAQQGSVVDARVAASQAERFVIPLCPLSMDSKLSTAQKGLRAGVEEKSADKKARGMADAIKALTEALTANPASGGALYYLGRYHLLLGDVVGMDSAWTKAEPLLPDCEPDMTSYRQNVWGILTNAGIEKQNAEDLDSAKVFYHRANHAFGALPHAFMNLGVIYANENNNDSAAVYFEKAVAATVDDSTMIEERKALLLNLGAIQQRRNNFREAVNTFGIYARENPEDSEVLRHLAGSYRSLNMPDSAAVIEAKLLESLSVMDLDQLDGSDLLAIGVGFFNVQQYERAADAFRRVVAQNPYDRDGLYNLANSYLALEDWERLAATSEALRVFEPMSEDVLKLHGQALRELKRPDAEVMAVAESLVGLPFNVEITRVSYTAEEARVSATATGREALTPAGRAIPPAPVILKFEFLDILGNVVGTAESAVHALPVGQTHQISLAAPVSQRVAGWRYSKK
ncbi:MAG: tetratricopeptide repeat protein [Gemmatimonadota bacterium]|nr:tetratricopeptide repeat protein [Gemmatimonadota bacterium]